eukprot:765035-Hanusia_phi.AAC.4
MKRGEERRGGARGEEEGGGGEERQEARRDEWGEKYLLEGQDKEGPKELPELPKACHEDQRSSAHEEATGLLRLRLPSPIDSRYSPPKLAKSRCLLDLSVHSCFQTWCAAASASCTSVTSLALSPLPAIARTSGFFLSAS